MLSLLLVVAFGLVFAYFASVNTELVTVWLTKREQYILPLYLIIFIPLAIGLVVAAVIHLVNLHGLQRMVARKRRELAEAQSTIGQLTRRVHELELENTKMKSKLGEESFDDESL